MTSAYIVAVACTPFGKFPDKGFREYATDLVSSLQQDLGEEAGGQLRDHVESIYFGNCFMDAWGQSSIRGQSTLIDVFDQGMLPTRTPITNVEAACATGSLAFHGAVRDVMSGQAEVSLAIAIEKLILPEGPAATLALFEGCTDNFTRDRLVDTYQAAAATVGRTLELGGDRSLFMDTYAMQALLHMNHYGTTVEQIAAGAAKNHNYGAQNPLAQYRFTTTVEEVLADREISHPLTRSMCSPVGDGGAAAVVCSEEWLERQPPEVRRRAVKVRGMAAAGGTYNRGPVEPSLAYYAAQKAYARAGVRPADIDVAEVHDATSFGEILQVEMLGFCEFGEGGPFVASGATGPGGTIPVNTSGGLVSKGHPVGATGLSMIHALTEQLRGEAGTRQVPNASLAIAENGGGVIGLEEATCAVTVLERVH